MADRDREQLLGYLLEALEDSERESLEVQLKHDLRLREELAEWDRTLRRLDVDRGYLPPPPGLAERTCRLVASCADSPSMETEEQSPNRPLVLELQPKAMNAVVEFSPQSGGFGWLDVGIAAVTVALGCLVIFPAIQKSRDGAQLAGCENNLQQIGKGLHQYSQIHDGYFPYVPETGKLAVAGSYAARLQSSGLLEDPSWVLCPAAPVARQSDFQVPTVDQVVATPEGPELARSQETMGGDFGYSFGHIEKGRYRGTRNQSRPSFALVADAPSGNGPYRQSANHGGRGQNVLFEDSHVDFLTTAHWEKPADDVYLNDTGLVGPGTHRNDAVIGSSGSTPIIFVGSRGW
jgi:hypothetical protein